MRGNKMTFPIMVEYYFLKTYMEFKLFILDFGFPKYSPNTCFTKRGNNMTFPIMGKVLEDIIFGVLCVLIALWVLRILIIVSN
jgi:hypothetical protein